MTPDPPRKLPAATPGAEEVKEDLQRAYESPPPRKVREPEEP